MIAPSAVIAALLVAGCGSSSHGGGSAPNALARAANISGAASGYRITLHLTEALGSAGAITATGSGSFNVPKKAGQMSMHMTLPAGAGLGTLDVREVIAGGNIYVRLPASLAGRLPGGKPWLEVNLAQAGRSAGISGLGSLTSGAQMNPTQFLQYLRAASSQRIENVGSATVNGIRTTHYRGRIELAKAVNAGTIPPGQRAAAAKAIAQLRALTGLSELPVDVWVDSAHLVRRLSMSYAMHAPHSSQPISIAMRMDFVGYGPQPVPAVPPAGQVTDITSMLGSLGAGTGTSG